MSRAPRLVLRLLGSSVRSSALRTRGSAALLPAASSEAREFVHGDAAGRLSGARALSSLSYSGHSEHTAKWMTDYENKTPQELINDVPPIEVRGRVVACEGSRDPALGHPVEYINLDLGPPATCKYCGLRYVQAGHHHH